MPAFSIPNIPSFTSTTPNQMPILFVPNVRYLRKFVDGDIGIAKKLMEKYHKKSLTQIKDKNTLQVYSKISGVKIGDNLDKFFQNGKFAPPASISIDKLPYEYDSLSSFIDSETMETHYKKHYKTYVEKLNVELEKVKGPDLELEEIIEKISKFNKL